MENRKINEAAFEAWVTANAVDRSDMSKARKLWWEARRKTFYDLRHEQNFCGAPVSAMVPVLKILRL